MPIDPCGLAVDVGRSAHVGQMAFWRNSDTRQAVRWYNLPDDAPVIGIPTSFGSTNWLDDKVGNAVPLGLVGEDQHPRPYNKGALPIFWAPRGGYCGSARQWQDGSVLGQDPPLVFNALGYATCCFNEVDPGFHTGGAAIGGSAFWGGFLSTGGAACEAPAQFI